MIQCERCGFKSDNEKDFKKLMKVNLCNNCYEETLDEK
jgi:NAD-dependent SIR2 family protein deacetylase